MRLTSVLVWIVITTTAAIAFPSDPARLLKLARQAVEAEVHGQSIPVPSTQSAPRAVFITIERHGKILGCRGSLTPLERSLEAEVIRAARAATKHDPRYKPIQPADLKDFLVTVTVVESLQAIDGVGDLTPDQGLVLKSGTKTGVVLPWEGKDPQVRLGWAYKKAGVSQGSAVTLYRLIAQRERG